MKPSPSSGSLATVTAQNYQRIPIHTVGVSPLSKIREDFLERLASSNGGDFTRLVR